MANNICIETTKYNSVCPLARRNRDFPTPLSPASVPLHPQRGGGGGGGGPTPPAGGGGGGGHTRLHG